MKSVVETFDEALGEELSDVHEDGNGRLVLLFSSGLVIAVSGVKPDDLEVSWA